MQGALSHAFRTLAKTPGYTAMAIVTLALGIGATTAIFTVLNAALLRPLPFPNAERIDLLWLSNPSPGYDQFAFSYLELRDVQAFNRAYEFVAEFKDKEATLVIGDRAEL